jgi:potassium/hydrogen antiporter
MIAGSEGPGGIYFEDAYLAQLLGVIALSFILFSGGLDTQFKEIRRVVGTGILLSTLGVVLTSVVVGWFAHAILGLPLLQGLLLGAIIS